ncbi:MAG: class I adenylate-forming enzyme family protein [Steroidobacteraceae bacterium]
MIHTHSLGYAARHYAGQIALARGEERWTFSDLETRAARLAGALSAHGLLAGHRLALHLPNGLEYIELIYACARAGVTIVPVNTRLASVEIDRVLLDAGPGGLLRNSSLPAGSTSLPWQQDLDREPLTADEVTASPPVYDPQALLGLIYTSGTTGRPKGAMVTHSAMLANVQHLNYWLPHAPGNVYLHAAPLFHIADLPFIFAAAAFGMCQVAIPKFTPELFCGMVESACVTHTVLVPTMIELLLEFTHIKQFDLSSLQLLGYGGSPMAPELVRRARQVLPDAKLTQVYGLSETGYLTGLQDHEHTQERLTSCGRSCPGVDLRVVDESGQELAAGHPGELVVRGANVMHGYWNDPAETAAAFRDGFFRTGDVGHRDASGYVYILDRIKDMIVTGGENVYSGEVEAVLQTHPAVREAAVFGIPDPKWGEIVMACVALKPNLALTTQDLITHCRESLAGYKVPRRIELADAELPKSGSGKILKRVLRERFWTSQSRAVS